MGFPVKDLSNWQRRKYSIKKWQMPGMLSLRSQGPEVGELRVKTTEDGQQQMWSGEAKHIPSHRAVVTSDGGLDFI